MANQIIFGATIVPANAPMEVSTNGGTTFAPLTFATVGSVQQATLTGVTAASYAAGQLIMGAVGYPATRLANAAAVTVAAVATPAPTITGFSPTSIAVGNALTISGTNFTGVSAVRINGTTASFTVLNATTINATVPAGATTGPVSVVKTGATVATTASLQIVVPASYAAGQLTDSLGVYRGQSISGPTTLDQTTSTWFFTQQRLAAAGYANPYTHHGYPGADAPGMLVTAYADTNGNEYSTGPSLPANQTPVQYFMAQFALNVTPVVIVAFGANNGTGRTPAQMLEDILLVHDAIHTARPDAITIAAQVFNRRDGAFSTAGIPGRASINAGLKAAVGTRCQGVVDNSNTPQLAADDAPYDSQYYWSPEFRGTSYVHRTTAGNRFVGQVGYAPVLAAKMGLVLPALAGESADSVSEVIDQTDLRLTFHNAPDSTVIRAFNDNFYNLRGGILPYAAGANLYVQITVNSYGLACYAPRSAAGAQDVRLVVGDLVNGVFTNSTEVATGTQYAALAAGQTSALSEIISTTFATKAVRTYRIVVGAATTDGQLFYVDQLKTPSIAGVFPATPQLQPATLRALAGVAVSANTFTSNAGITQFAGVAVSTQKLAGPGILRWVPTAASGSGTFVAIASSRTAAGTWQSELAMAVYHDSGTSCNLWSFGSQKATGGVACLNKPIDFVLTADPYDSTVYQCQVVVDGANIGAAYPIPSGQYMLTTGSTVGAAGTATYVTGDLVANP